MSISIKRKSLNLLLEFTISRKYVNSNNFPKLLIVASSHYYILEQFHQIFIKVYNILEQSKIESRMKNWDSWYISLDATCTRVKYKVQVNISINNKGGDKDGSRKKKKNEHTLITVKN